MKYSLCPGVLAVALLGLGAARGQAPGYPPAGLGSQAYGPAAGQPGASATVLPQPGPQAPDNGAGNVDGAMPTPGGPEDRGTPGITDYLGYLRPWNCCGPLGRDGPITSEVFVRPGLSFPIGGSLLGRVLAPGGMVEGGGRVLFFTPKQDLAFTVELGIASIWWKADVNDTVFIHNFPQPRRSVGTTFFQGQTFTNGQVITSPTGNAVIDLIPAIPITTSSVNQTYVHASLGHEVYLWGVGDCSTPECRWRVGYDMGGRWGSAKLVFQEQFFVTPDPTTGTPTVRPMPFKHRTDTVGGMFFALHSDLEIPTKCCLFFVGVRTEFAYIWSDILQRENNTDLMMINLMANVGLRF
jgi:hypothetical protein